MIGHITQKELRQAHHQGRARQRIREQLLISACRRVRLLPEGGDAEPAERDRPPAIPRRDAAARRHTAARSRSPQTRGSCGGTPTRSSTQAQDGLAGHITARAEAHAIRLALIYTLLDGEHQCSAEHLQAALALWDYATRSAALGARASDRRPARRADSTQRWISAPDGLTRSQLSPPRATQPPRRTARTSACKRSPPRARQAHQDQDRRSSRRTLARHHHRLNPESSVLLGKRSAFERGRPLTWMSAELGADENAAPTITLN